MASTRSVVGLIGVLIAAGAAVFVASLIVFLWVEPVLGWSRFWIPGVFACCLVAVWLPGVARASVVRVRSGTVEFGLRGFRSRSARTADVAVCEVADEHSFRWLRLLDIGGEELVAVRTPVFDRAALASFVSEFGAEFWFARRVVVAPVRGATSVSRSHRVVVDMGADPRGRVSLLLSNVPNGEGSCALVEVASWTAGGLLGAVEVDVVWPDVGAVVALVVRSDRDPVSLRCLSIDGRRL